MRGVAKVQARIPTVRKHWERSLFGEAWERSDQLDLGVAALALGAQEVLCTAPMLVALSSIMMRFRLGFVGAFLNDVLGLNKTAGLEVRSLFTSTRAPQLSSLWLGLATAILFYTSVAATTQRAVDAIWERHMTGFQAWWRRTLWVLGQIPLFAVALAASHFMRTRHIPDWERNVIYAIAFSFGVSLFHLWGHHLFLEGKVTWRALIPGSIAMALGILILGLTSPYLMSSQIVDNVADYGLIGAAFILSLWAVSYSAIVVFATLLGQVWHMRRTGARRPATDGRPSDVLQTTA